MHKCKKSGAGLTGYRYPSTESGARNDSRMSQSERMRRERERKALKSHKREDCRQLAIYVKDGSGRTLAGIVNDYGSVMWWHDVTTNGSVGRPVRIESLCPGTLNKFAGTAGAHVFAQRF